MLKGRRSVISYFLIRCCAASTKPYTNDNIQK